MHGQLGRAGRLRGAMNDEAVGAFIRCSGCYVYLFYCCVLQAPPVPPPQLSMQGLGA